MGWTASYQIFRDRPLDDAELAALDDFITRHNAPPWEGEGFGLAVTRAARADGLVGHGWQKLPMTSDESEDHQRLCDVLNAVAAVVPDVTVRIWDDFGMFGLDADGRVDQGGRPGPRLVELDAAERDTFKAPDAWLPPRFAPMPAALTAWLDGQPADLAIVRLSLTTLASWPAQHPARGQLSGRLDAVAPALVAEAGFADYDDVQRSSEAWRIVGAALDRLDPIPAEIVAAFLHVWRNPRGIYWYGDLHLEDRVRDRLAAVPEVEAQMLEDLAAAVDGTGYGDIVHRRAEHAAMMLGRARSTAGLRALLAAARSLRGTPFTSDLGYHTYPGIIEGLALAAVPAVVPALLLEVGTGDRWLRHRVAALRVLTAVAPARVAPLIGALVEVGEVFDAVAWVVAIGGDTVTPWLTRLARSADAGVARCARGELAARGEAVPDEVVRELPARLVDPSGAARRAALDELVQGGPGYLRCYVVGDEVDRAARARLDETSTRWTALSDLVPPALRRRPLAERLAWIDAGGDGTLPPQVWLTELDAVIAAGAEAIAAAMPRPWPRLTEASERALLAEEAAVVSAVAAGTLEPSRVVDSAAIAPAPVELCDAHASSPPPIPATAAADAPAAAVSPDPVGRPDQDGAAPDEPPPLADEDVTIDALLDVLARDVPVPPELVARAKLPRSIAGLDAYARADAIRDDLLARDRTRVGQRLLAGLATLAQGYPVARLAERVLPYAAAGSAGGAEVARWWYVAHDTPWDNASRISEILASVAAAPALMAACVDELAAPAATTYGGRARSALDLVARATTHVELVTAVIVARLRRDRGRSPEEVPWRTDAYRALRRIASPVVAPTVRLELAAATLPSEQIELMECLAASDLDAADELRGLVDVPGLAGEATRARVRGGMETEAGRTKLLAHPYWKIRLMAADQCRDWGRARVETCAVWAAVDAAGLPTPGDERAHALGDGRASWDELALAHGRPITLPALPPAVAGVASSCADYRRWALWAVDQAPTAGLAPARVLADELDRALSGRGHPRTPLPWSRWQAVVAGLPAERHARLAWAIANRPDDLDPILARVIDDDAATVAAALPAARYTLTADQRAALVLAEATVADRGDAIFRDGLPELPELAAPVEAAPPTRPRVESYF
ncbi:MAG: hypothetical protein R3B06_27655 [Kofleriaceae bacterium]